jgi:hypothetical protein
MNRFILFMLLILSDLAISCSEVEKDRSLKKVRVMWVVDKGRGYEPADSNVAIIEIDTLYKTGDIITRGPHGSKFRVID